MNARARSKILEAGALLSPMLVGLSVEDERYQPIHDALNKLAAALLAVEVA